MKRCLHFDLSARRLELIWAYRADKSICRKRGITKSAPTKFFQSSPVCAKAARNTNKLMNPSPAKSATAPPTVPIKGMSIQVNPRAVKATAE